MYTNIIFALLFVACVSAGHVKVGGVSDMPLEELEADKLLMGGLDAEVEKMNTDRRHKFRTVRHSIIKASKQVVAGMLYHVMVRIVDSTCQNVKENDGKTIKECPAAEGAMLTTCVISMWSRPWIKDSSKFIVKTKCLRMSTTADNGVKGGVEDMSLEELTADKLLMGGLDAEVEKMNANREQLFRTVRHSIVKATKQVVSGMLYHVTVRMVESTCDNEPENDGKTIKECPAAEGAMLTTCVISMWSRPWIKDASKFIVKTKCLRMSTMADNTVGGVEDMPLEELEADKLLMGGLDAEVEKMNANREQLFRTVRHSIVKATKQVVSGMLYHVTVRMVESTCDNEPENDGKTIKECPAAEGAMLTTCVISMWSRPWIKDASKFIVKTKCLRMIDNAIKVGGVSDMPLKELEADKLLMGGLDAEVEKMNADRRHEFRTVRHSIIKASKQVVAGMLYHVMVRIVDSTCQNVKENDGKTIKECPAAAGAMLTTCVISMWSRPWIKDASKFIVKTKCLRMADNAIKVGGVSDMPLEELEADKLLMGGLDAEVEKMNADRRHQFRTVRHSIIKASKQVVAGMLYHVMIRIVDSTCQNVKENDGKTIKECPAEEGAMLTTCVISMWSRPWIKDSSKFIVKTKCLRM